MQFALIVSAIVLATLVIVAIVGVLMDRSAER